MAYNQEQGITPQSIVKQSGNSILEFLDVSRRLNAQQLETPTIPTDEVPLEAIPPLIDQLEKQMKQAAKQLEFEQAAELRDRIKQLRDKLVGQE
jgi:excinuclease ABC subunit B